MGQINDLAKQVMINAANKGWYLDGGGSNMGERLALIHSELSEALEADRNERYAVDTARGFEIIKDDAEFKEWFETYIKNTFEDEIADVVIRCLDTAEYMGFDLERHILCKMRYNTLREKKHGNKKY